MYEINSQKLFHGQWYQHGSKTLLQETANPQSLFLIDDCEPDIPLASIYQKCNLRELSVDEDEPADETSPHENNFYHGCVDHKSGRYYTNESAQLDMDTARPIACAAQRGGCHTRYGSVRRGHNMHLVWLEARAKCATGLPHNTSPWLLSTWRGLPRKRFCLHLAVWKITPSQNWPNY